MEFNPQYLDVALGIPLGLAYGNFCEWSLHQFLHRAGRKKGHFFRFHWHDHHRLAHRDGHFDEGYAGSVFQWNHVGKEAAALFGMALLHIPLFFFAPVFTAVLFYCAFNYYRVHRKSHLDPAWARQYTPWHVDHHVGPNQDANWCVTKPWSDLVLGTREYYVGTEKERQDLLRKELKKNKKLGVNG